MQGETPKKGNSHNISAQILQYQVCYCYVHSTTMICRYYKYLLYVRSSISQSNHTLIICLIERRSRKGKSFSNGRCVKQLIVVGQSCTEHKPHKGENSLLVLCCMLYDVLCYAAAPSPLLSGVVVFTLLSTYRSRCQIDCYSVQCTIQGPLCVNENNGYNGLSENFL